MGPTVSSVWLTRSTPKLLTRPCVVFRPVRPQKAEGMRTDPPVSVPIAPAARPADTATPEPLLEPPTQRSTAPSQGFTGERRPWLVPQPP